MRLNKKLVIKYLKRLLKKVNGSDYMYIKNCILTLEEMGEK